LYALRGVLRWPVHDHCSAQVDHAHHQSGEPLADRHLPDQGCVTVRIRPFIEPWQLLTVSLAWLASSGIALALWGDTAPWFAASFLSLGVALAVVARIQIRRSRETAR